MNRLFGIDAQEAYRASLSTSGASSSSEGSLLWLWILLGLIVAALIILFVWLIMSACQEGPGDECEFYKYYSHFIYGYWDRAELRGARSALDFFSLDLLEGPILLPFHSLLLCVEGTKLYYLVHY